MDILAISQNFIEVAVEGIATIELPWIANLIKWLFDLFSGVPGAIGLGAILFTLALKTLVLPLDIYSRVKMKKQSLVMEKMRPQMEKLQQQYANDSNLYQQKVLELQKANGYNPLSACLPTIVSLVIFMVVFSAFTQYSQYSNLTQYNNLTQAYSQAVREYVETEKTGDGDQYFLTVAREVGVNNYESCIPIGANENGVFLDGSGNEIKIYGYYVNYDKFQNYYTTLPDVEALPQNWSELSEAEKNATVISYVRLGARAAAADYYRSTRPETSFLWIGNLWYPDSMFNKEIPSFSDFSGSISRAAGAGVPSTYEQSYNEVTYDLSKEKDTWNGYFVLIILAIGLMFLQQFITMRSQKAASELSSVDGSAARTNKIMMVLMPIIFGIFSFLYSAAFSIYMIVNTVYSLVSTLIINKAVSVRFEKKAEREVQLRKAGRAGRKRLK